MSPHRGFALIDIRYLRVQSLEITTCEDLFCYAMILGELFLPFVLGGKTIASPVVLFLRLHKLFHSVLARSHDARGDFLMFGRQRSLHGLQLWIRFAWC